MKKITIATTLVLAASGIVIYSNAIGSKTGQFDQKQVSDIQKIIHDYLVSKPEVLVEASAALQKKQESNMIQKAKTAISAHATTIFGASSTTSYGNPNGTVNVVEFLDYQCGHCKLMSPIVQDVLQTNTDVRFVVKELPIFGANSDFAARAAIAAAEQGSDKFRDFHIKLLETKKPLNEENILELAKESGLDSTKLKADMDKEDTKKHIKDNFALAQDLGLQGTPAFIIGNKDGSKNTFIPGATSKEKIEEAIKSITTSS